jgi:hypothetical protein
MAIAAYGLSMFTRFASSAVTLLVLTACASSNSSRGQQSHREPLPAPAASAGVVPDASYDWHGLVLAPFGTLLKESPIALHEVLLFHDAAHNSGDVDSRDCYAIDGAPPRFVGHQPDQYLLCFDHDRLNRIEASVRLPADEASQAFARACALWLKNTEPTAGGGTTCEGRDGGTAFSARLGLVPGEDSAPLSMTLSSAAPSEAVGRPAVNDAIPDAPHEK